MGFVKSLLNDAANAAFRDNSWSANMRSMEKPQRVNHYGKPCRSCKGLGDHQLGKNLAKCGKCRGTGRR